MKHRVLAFAAAACIAFPSLPAGMLNEMKVYAATELPGISADYAEMYGANVIINDGIGMTFYLQIGSKLDEVLDTAYMELRVGDSTDTQKIFLKSLTPVTVNGTKCYAVNCQLVARQMNDTIYVKLVLDDTTASEEETYSVSQYGKSILNDNSGIYSEKTKQLVKAMLDYGSYTQLYFDYPTGCQAKDVFSISGSPLTTLPTAVSDDYAMTTSGTLPTGLIHYGATLLLKTRTGMRQYFKVEEGHSISEYGFQLKDESGKTTLEAKQNFDLYYVEIPNIAAKKLGTKFTLTVTDLDDADAEYKVKACPLSYGTNSLDKGNTNLDNTVYALYGYYLAALEYVEEYNQMMLGKYKGLVINEICSVNSECLKVGKDNFPDWLEIYNGSDNEIELDGFGLSDDADKPFSYTFPENTKIAKGSYLLVYCDSKDETYQYNTSFGLSSSGETVLLTHPEYGVIDSVEFGTIDANLSYARKPDGSDEWSVYHVTPNASNNNAKSAVPAAAPTFSIPSGFYSGTQSLKLTPPQNCDVYYTLDGSDPTTSATKVKYSGAITITDGTDRANNLAACDDFCIDDSFTPSNEDVPKGTVVKAVAVPKDSSEPSAVVTNTYFVDKTESFYDDMYVISLSSDPKNFIGKGEKEGLLVCGQQYQDYLNDPTHDKLDAYDKRNPTNYNDADLEHEVTMEVFKNKESVYTGNVGLQVSGNATRSYKQKSMNIYARAKYGSTSIDYAFFDGLTSEAGEPIESFTKLTLRNGGNDFNNARIRDDIIQNLVADDSNYAEGEEVKVGTLAKCDTVVFLDGEFWGYYSMQEKLCETYVESHYGVKEKNVSIIKSGDEIPDEEGKTDLDSYGEEYMAYAAEASTADMTVPENYAKFCETVDIDSFIDYVAVEAYISNYDWTNERGTNNWFMWRSTKNGEGYKDGKWRFAIYDTEFSTNLYGYSDTRCYHNGDIWGYFSACPDDTALGRIFLNLLKNTEFRDRFYARFDEIAKKTFYAEYPAVISSRVDANTERIRSAIDATNVRYGTNDMNVWALDYLKSFFENRYEPAIETLDYLLGYKELPNDDLVTNIDIWWVNNCDGGDSAMQKNSANEIVIEVKNTGSKYYSVQPIYGGLNLYGGHEYELTYDISCNTNGKLKCCVMQDYDPWVEYYAAVETPTASNPTHVQTTFMMPETCGNARISFDIGDGYNKGTYTISNVQIHRVN